MRLENRKYTLQEIRNFKEEAKTNKSADFLFQNVQALRLLGWQIKTGSRIPHKNLNGYYDVVKYDPQLAPRTMKLYKPEEVRSKNDR